ncbi:hypothetical protein SLEP1_g58884 [Rubroshorea leprosula]|uniref:Uncharacterized protein n=1 Tax=Rubroshorea leprosula TaxID=152421 RepID=A0AAV5MRT8_9ROSI|nr:hypothetical protein SLEP1_g58884 [Rubroshorea leprosula]
MQVMYCRIKDALIQMSKGVLKEPIAVLVPVLFGDRPPTLLKKDVTFTPFYSILDHSQPEIGPMGKTLLEFHPHKEMFFLLTRYMIDLLQI